MHFKKTETFFFKGHLGWLRVLRNHVVRETRCQTRKRHTLEEVGKGREKGMRVTFKYKYITYGGWMN